MKRVYLTISIIFYLLCAGCAGKKYVETSQNWVIVIKAPDFEVFVDTASIKRNETTVTTREKKIFTSQTAKDEYLSKIKGKYSKKNADKKILKWSDYSYTIYTSEYDCLNSRHKKISVEDYDSQNNLIIKTPSRKEWIDIEDETVGDYTFFFVCDYEK